MSLPRLYTAAQSIDLCILTEVLGREAGNQPREAIEAVGCSIRNRVRAALKKKWGIGWAGVIEHAWQYSSIDGSPTDPNLRKYPNLDVVPWPECLDVAEAVYAGELVDQTGGAHSYFDRSLDANPPVWSTDGEYIHTYNIGSFRFFRLRVLG